MSTYGHAYQRVRAELVRKAQWCAICGRPLDKGAPPRSPRSPSVDHVWPVSAMRDLDPETRARLLVDRRGLRVVHLGCNAARGAGRRPRRHVSRNWS